MNAVAAVRALGGAQTVPYLVAVEARLAATLGPGVVGRAATETLAAGGKRLRPLLVLLSAPIDGRDDESLEVAGAAVELVHMATLVHDDVLDRALLRRGKPTTWALHGEAVAVSTGDHLFARAFRELASTGRTDAVSLLAQASLELARGEAMQAAQTSRPETTVDAYLERCRLKTGRLFAVACSLGGIYGGLEADEVALLDRFGDALGIAFQLADDLLDCAGEAGVTGKAVGTDLLDGTVTMPLLVAAQRDLVIDAALRSPPSEAAIPDLLARIEASGALDDTRREIRARADVAYGTLTELSERADGASLGAIVQAATERES